MAVSEGGKLGTPGRKMLDRSHPVALVDGGPQVTGQRIKEILAMGADGVAVPHVENLDQGRQVVSLFTDARANVPVGSSPPNGTVIAMMMLEDPHAVAQAAQIADLGGYSVLGLRARPEGPPRAAFSLSGGDNQYVALACAPASGSLGRLIPAIVPNDFPRPVPP